MDAQRTHHHPWRCLATIALTLLATTACAGDSAPTAEPEEAGRVAASFEVRAVIGQADSAEAEPTADGGVVLENRDHPGEFLDLGPRVLDADDVHHARTVEQEGWAVHVALTDEGSERFADVTAAAACAEGDANRVAIVVDGSVASSPSVNVRCGSEIRAELQIHGYSTEEDADEVVSRLTAD